MKPAAFEYVVAESVEAAVAVLSAGDAKILAGGQSLVPMLNFRLLRPAILVDINRIPGLAFVRDDGGAVTVGALTRHHQLETSPVIAAHFPVLAEAMTYVAHLAIRNRGTIGGSLSHADPAAELPMMALLLDAKLRLASAAGVRTVAAHDFLVDTLAVDLAEGEMLTEISFPKLPPHTGWGFEEISRRSGDFALAAVAATLSLQDGVIREARIVMTGVAPTARRAGDAEKMLIGARLGGGIADNIIEAVQAVAEPDTDLHASADYRRHLVGVLARKALLAAWTRAA